MPQLAIMGGKPIREQHDLFPAYNTIGEEEIMAVTAVLMSGNLSQFLGTWSDDFLGGPMVRKLEEKWCEAININYAVSVNSNTSGLFASLGAIGIQTGEEVIVSPYTMTASAVAPLVYGGVPVFADIHPDTFCLDPKSIREKITPRTKAILIVHILGHPAEMDEIMAIAKEFNLIIIEDCAQTPKGKYKGRYLGTIGDIGVFSLNYHKHIHTGEGGVVVTNNKHYAERVQLIRNHGENVVDAKGIIDITNMIGYNYRMTEIEAAIGIEQLKKIDELIEQRLLNVKFLNAAIGSLPGFTAQPYVDETSLHTYYIQPFKYNQQILGIHRNDFVAAIQAEIPTSRLREAAPLIGAGYVRPLYLQSIYQKRAAFAFTNEKFRSEVNYSKGSCPVTEKMHFNELITTEYMRPGMTKKDLDDVVKAFEKVVKYKNELEPRVLSTARK
jgi:perosamine synthetase